MWFKNVLIYQINLTNPEELAKALANDALKPCPPHARCIYGWLEVFDNNFVHDIAGAYRFTMGKEERILPRSVILNLLDKQIKTIEHEQNRQVKSKERSQLAEDLEFELLPKSFVVQKRLPAYIDTIAHRLIINTASTTQASHLLGLLRKSVPNLRIEPLAHIDNLALRFTEWLTNPTSLPANFQLAPNCLLFSRKDEKKKINCKGYELPAEEISTLITQGLDAAEISLIWNERIGFTLTQDLLLKRVQSLDYLVDEFNEINQIEEHHQQEDAHLTLLAGELRNLITELLTALEVKPSTSVQSQPVTFPA